MKIIMKIMKIDCLPNVIKRAKPFSDIIYVMAKSHFLID